MQRYFLIKCTCGHMFWRSHPCNNRLRPWDCPRRRQGGTHQTTLTTLTEQMAQIARERTEVKS